MLWMILTLMAVFAAVGLTIPLVRRRDASAESGGDAVGVLREQLGEIEAQASVGSLSEGEAEALKSDLKRRVLAEGRRPEAPARPLSERTVLILALGVVGIVTLAGTGLYLTIGRPDVASKTATPGPAAMATDASGHPQGDVATMIGQLEQQLKTQPGNVEGWRMLGWSYMQTGRAADAANAYGRAAQLDPQNPEYVSALGEATVMSSDGQVTPAAEAAFRKAVALDPNDPRARYFLGVAKDQRGDHKGAIDDWVALLKSAPADAPWAAEVRAFAEKSAAANGIDLAGRLPPLAAAPPMAAPPPAGPPPGPTAEQMAAAQSMSPADRQAMIQNMVGGLAERLKQNPRDRAGWERLIRARMVLGQAQEAAAAYRDATRAFAGSPADQRALQDTARQLSVPGA